jgi:hypothetical protein
LGNGDVQTPHTAKTEAINPKEAEKIIRPITAFCHPAKDKGMNTMFCMVYICHPAKDKGINTRLCKVYTSLHLGLFLFMYLETSKVCVLLMHVII